MLAGIVRYRTMHVCTLPYVIGGLGIRRCGRGWDSAGCERAAISRSFLAPSAQLIDRIRRGRDRRLESRRAAAPKKYLIAPGDRSESLAGHLISAPEKFVFCRAASAAMERRIRSLRAYAVAPEPLQPDACMRLDPLVKSREVDVRASLKPTARVTLGQRT